MTAHKYNDSHQRTSIKTRTCSRAVDMWRQRRRCPSCRHTRRPTRPCTSAPHAPRAPCARQQREAPHPRCPLKHTHTQQQWCHPLVVRRVANSYWYSRVTVTSRRASVAVWRRLLQLRSSEKSLQFVIPLHTFSRRIHFNELHWNQSGGSQLLPEQKHKHTIKIYKT